MSRNADQRRFNEKQAAYFLSSTLLKPLGPRSFQGHDWLEIAIAIGGVFTHITYNTCTSSRLTGLDQRNNENKKRRKCRTSAERTMEFPRLACRKRLRIIYSVLTSGHALLYGQTLKDLVTVLWRLVRFTTDTARRPLDIATRLIHNSSQQSAWSLVRSLIEKFGDVKNVQWLADTSVENVITSPKIIKKTGAYWRPIK